VFNFESAEAGEEEVAMATRLLVTTERSQTRPKSGYYGVTASGSKWHAHIDYAGEIHWLGTFRTKEEAAAAYDTAARQHKSEYSGVVYNFESAEAGETAVTSTQGLETTDQRPRPRPKSGYSGVYARGSKWHAHIGYAGKIHYLGKFRTKEEAAAAYDTAARQHKSGESGVVFNFESAEAGEEAAALSTRGLETSAERTRPRPRSTSGCYGVWPRSGNKWKALITYAGKTHWLGKFRTKEEAAAAYDTAARQHKNGESGVVYNFESAEAGEAAAVTSTRGLETSAQQPKPRPTSGYSGVYAS
jgi:hypothetical protein